MQIHRLIYKSIATPEVVSNEILRELESQAAAANAEKDITGLLVLSGNVFVQVLEGSAEVLTALFGRIMQDKRHHQVTLITFQPVVERCFEDWTMSLVDLFDLPGEKRALMQSKYIQEQDDIRLPTEVHEVHAFLLDARCICLSSPWSAPVGSGGGAARDKVYPR